MTAVDKALLEIDRACSSGAVVREPDVLETYSHDESEAAPTMPEALVRVRSTAEVAAVLRAATKYSIPVTPRAGGTSRVGGSVPSTGSIVLSVEKMDQMKGDTKTTIAVTEPGITPRSSSHRRSRRVLPPIQPTAADRRQYRRKRSWIRPSAE